MKALVYTAPNEVAYRDEPEPAFGDGDVLIEVEAVGICGSDLHAYHGHDPRRVPPMILGHELVGRIVKGPGAGRRATVNPLIACGHCEYCVQGRDNLCANRTMIGMSRPGGFADRLATAARTVIDIPQEMAARLSEDGRHSVLLLEAGPKDDYLWIHVPIGYGKTMFHPQYNWGFHTEPEPTMANRKIYWPRGRGLGGSSSINGLIYVRGQREDYDAWAAAGNRGWGWKDVLPYFRKLEDNSRGASEHHGAGGPIACTDIPAGHELMDAIVAAGQELGVPKTGDFNAGDQEGVGYYQLFTRNGLRCSAAVGYLKPARNRANLKVETDAHAERVLFEGTRAVGVQYRRGTVAKARREVILCAGAIQSPQLLQLSGVGPGPLLQSLGVPVVHELPGVGENLQDHLQMRVIFKCTKPITTNDDLASWWRSMKIGLQWILARSGPLAIGINQGGLFTRALPESKTPDIQFHFATISADLAGAKPHPFSGFTFSVCQLRPESRGFVRAKTPNALDAPAMQPNYLSTELDRRCAIEGVKYARRLAATKALQPYVLEEYRPGPAAKSDDDLLAFCREYGATIFHPSGTCKMGSDPMAVVDDQLRVHGVANLRVVDCSIMPTLVSGNTNAPVAMIAEKASDLILRGN